MLIQIHFCSASIRFDFATELHDTSQMIIPPKRKKIKGWFQFHQHLLSKADQQYTCIGSDNGLAPMLLKKIIVRTLTLHLCLPRYSLWPVDVIWGHRSWSTLAEVRVYCLTASDNYLNQCWLMISKILWHSPESNFTTIAHATILYNAFKNHTFKITATSLQEPMS